MVDPGSALAAGSNLGYTGLEDLLRNRASRRAEGEDPLEYFEVFGDEDRGWSFLDDGTMYFQETVWTAGTGFKLKVRENFSITLEIWTANSDWFSDNLRRGAPVRWVGNDKVVRNLFRSGDHIVVTMNGGDFVSFDIDSDYDGVLPDFSLKLGGEEWRKKNVAVDDDLYVKLISSNSVELRREEGGKRDPPPGETLESFVDSVTSGVPGSASGIISGLAKIPAAVLSSVSFAVGELWKATGRKAGDEVESWGRVWGEPVLIATLSALAIAAVLRGGGNGE